MYQSTADAGKVLNNLFWQLCMEPSN